MADRFEIDSCGTGGGSSNWYLPGGFSYHEGDPADSRMTATARKRGVNLTSRSRPLKPQDLAEVRLCCAWLTGHLSRRVGDRRVMQCVLRLCAMLSTPDRVAQPDLFTLPPGPPSACSLTTSSAWVSDGAVQGCALAAAMLRIVVQRRAGHEQRCWLVSTPELPTFTANIAQMPATWRPSGGQPSTGGRTARVPPCPPTTTPSSP